MATIQAKSSRGHKYWYIVESRRVNGKPRPVVLAYLGKADDLLRRLQGLTGHLRIKSYSHGALAALLETAYPLDIPSLINGYIKSPRKYISERPVRHGLTAGMTLMLGAIGRVCMPTSKRGWWNWAKTTSCEYLLRCGLSRIDSRHFWDLMDALPVSSIPKIEEELLGRVLSLYPVEPDTLFFDTTNFFTFIDSTNVRCRIARRGHNKQKRNDLRQVGLAMVVTRDDFIPLLHHAYQGNLHDSTVFGDLVTAVKERMVRLGLDLQRHTLVFDQGNNSKENLALIENVLQLHYVAALSPFHHKALVAEARASGQDLSIPENAYRTKKDIWGKMRTAVVFVSETLKAGQLRGIHQTLEKKKTQLQKISEALDYTGAKAANRAAWEEKIKCLVKGRFLSGLIQWSLAERTGGGWKLQFCVSQEKLKALESNLGLRILITDRHDWKTEEIIRTYHGQSTIERAFRNLKNPYHLALRPQFHWTDQKITVHYFICVLGYLLATLVWRQARTKGGFTGTLDTLLDDLGNIRLAAVLEDSSKPGPLKADYRLEEQTPQEKNLMQALNIEDFHNRRPRFNGVGVYK